jgi:hypothetical protein
MDDAAGSIVLDGSFVKDRLYAALVAGLRPGAAVLVSADAYGTAAGAALLVDHPRRSGPVELALERAAPLSLSGLQFYRGRWRQLAADRNGAAATMDGDR